MNGTFMKHRRGFASSLIFILALSCIANDRASAAQNLIPPDPLYRNQLSGNLSFHAKYTHKTPTANPNLTEAEKKAFQEVQSQFHKITRLEVVQTGEVRKDRVFYDDGSHFEIWRSGNMRFKSSSLSNSTDLYFTDQYGYQDPPDFTDLTWITRETYQGAQIRESRKCHVYKLQDRSAWIDAATLLPLYQDSSSLTITYTYQDPPSDPLKLPEKFTRQLAQLKNVLAGRKP
jgi:hypothetical protein